MTNFTTLFNENDFISRHNALSDDDKQQMLARLGYETIEQFIDDTVPQTVRSKRALSLPKPLSEHSALAKLRAMADNITVNKSYIGQGYSPTRMPAVIQRNMLENPGWYTAYTPYQAEIAQGRLEALLNFQQMCIDLTGLAKRVSKSKSNQFFVDDRVYPQTLDVINTRAQYFSWEVVVGDLSLAEEGDFFGALFQYVGKEGRR